MPKKAPAWKVEFLDVKVSEIEHGYLLQWAARGWGFGEIVVEDERMGLEFVRDAISHALENK